MNSEFVQEVVQESSRGVLESIRNKFAVLLIATIALTSGVSCSKKKENVKKQEDKTEEFVSFEDCVDSKKEELGTTSAKSSKADKVNLDCLEASLDNPDDESVDTAKEFFDIVASLRIYPEKDEYMKKYRELINRYMVSATAYIIFDHRENFKVCNERYIKFRNVIDKYPRFEAHANRLGVIFQQLLDLKKECDPRLSDQSEGVDIECLDKKIMFGAEYFNGHAEDWLDLRFNYKSKK